MPELDPGQVVRWLRSSTLLSPQRALNPQVGDTVVECSRFKIDPTMLGTLDGISQVNGGTEYHVTSWTGEKQRWLNADARTVSVPIRYASDEDTDS